jgi:hypothetical protein
VLITSHVLSGALIGAAVRRPLPAFALGVVSHFALDALPHWGEWGSQRRFLRVAVPDGLAGLAAIGIVAAATPPEHRTAVVAGMTGAALPDLDKPAVLWFGRSPFPGAVDRFHSAIQDEAPDRFRLEMTVMAALTAASLVAVRATRRAAARRAASPGQQASAASRRAAGTRGRPGRRCRRS